MNQRKTNLLLLIACVAGLNSCVEDNPEIANIKDSSEKTSAVNNMQTASVESYGIPVGNITDHADASIQGSIAWYLANKGGGTEAEPHTFYLESNAVYNTKKSIKMPPHARLTEASGVQAVIQCDPVNW
ncbi:MAG: hypothetical protein EOP54_19155, partial [Sphingobacteriales bacterium]